MKLRRIPRGAGVMAMLAVVLGALLAFVLPSSADVSAESPSIGAIRVESPGKLKAQGAGLVVSVTVVCTPGQTAFVNLEVTQRVNNRIARGFGSDRIDTCTGGAQTVELSMSAQDAPFHRGVAFGRATLFVSNNPDSIIDAREIQLVR